MSNETTWAGKMATKESRLAFYRSELERANRLDEAGEHADAAQIRAGAELDIEKETKNERVTADAMAPVLMERLNGGRGIVRVGDVVTPREPEGANYGGWSELTVDGFTPAGGISWVAQDGKTTGYSGPEMLLLTSHSELQARAQLESIRELVAALKAKQDAEEKDDDELEAIGSDPLSVEVRSRWMELRDFGNKEQGAPDEFKILLCTGGPAVQIRGELDDNQEPEKPRLQHQDWGTPWTDYRLTVEEEQTLLEYCRCFCFES